MAGISALQRLLDNALTSKFVKSLNHSDLPEGWADNPEIVELAGDAYREMGTDSPFFKAWFGNSKVVDEAGEPLEVYRGGNAKYDEFRTSKTGNLGPAIYITPDRSGAVEYAATHDNGKVFDLFAKSDNPLKISNSLAAGEEFWGNLAGKTEKEAIEDLFRQGYDGAWAVGVGETPWGKSVPELAVYSSNRIKSTSNRGTFNPDDPNILRTVIPAVGAGGMLGLLTAEDAEAAPAIKGLSKKYAKAAKDGYPKNLESGTIYDRQLEELKKRDKRIKNSRLIARTHGADAREATGEMTNEEVGEYLERLLNDLNAETYPNFPSREVRDAKSIMYGDYRGDEELAERFGRAKDVAMPVRGGKDGDVMMNTIFEPTGENRKYIDRLRGRPQVTPISGLRNNPASAQPRGLSVVDSRSMESNIPSSSSSRKSIIPLTVGGVLLPTTAEAIIPEESYVFPADRPGFVNPEPGVESPIVDPVDILMAPIGAVGAGARAAAMAAEPFLAYGMDKAVGGILDWFLEDD